MVGRLACSALIVLALVWPWPARAEVIELSGGEWVEGKLKEVSPNGVSVEVGGQTITFPPDRVLAIYFRGPSQGPPTQPPPPPTPPPAAPPPAVTAPPLPTSGVSLPPAAPALPPTSPVSRSSSPAADALQVVKALRAAILSGMSFREYQSKVNAAANIVERYLAALPDGPETESISDAVRYFTLAESAWNNQGTITRTVWLRKADALDRCTAYQDYAKSMQSKGEAFYAERIKNYVVISDGVISVLWSCASEKIAEAETLLANNTTK
ncbi:MAG TPA: hypothetical protein VMS64_31405 [Candidatus Methylomirabilis sp.]|nr:hypothetical protein [Candidatus Methylomirabilis sp.]